MDDEPALLRLMTMYLSRLKYEVDGTLLGLEAWRKFEAAPESYDLVIADLSMPDVDVEAMLPRFPALNPRIHVMVCSGRVYEPATLPRAIQANFSFLQKPFVPKMLADATAAALAGNGDKGGLSGRKPQASGRGSALGVAL